MKLKDRIFFLRFNNCSKYMSKVEIEAAFKENFLSHMELFAYYFSNNKY